MAKATVTQEQAQAARDSLDSIEESLRREERALDEEPISKESVLKAMKLNILAAQKLSDAYVTLFESDVVAKASGDGDITATKDA